MDPLRTFEGAHSKLLFASRTIQGAPPVHRPVPPSQKDITIPFSAQSTAIIPVIIMSLDWVFQRDGSFVILDAQALRVYFLGQS